MSNVTHLLSQIEYGDPTAAEKLLPLVYEELRRGGDLQRRDVELVEIAAAEPSSDVVAVDEALRRFEAVDPIKAQLVKLRYFAGLTIPETASALGISTATADRYWAYARAWLHAEIGHRGENPGSE